MQLTLHVTTVVLSSSTVKVGEGVEESGLDQGLHGEAAYTGNL